MRMSTNIAQNFHRESFCEILTKIWIFCAVYLLNKNILTNYAPSILLVSLSSRMLLKFTMHCKVTNTWKRVIPEIECCAIFFTVLYKSVKKYRPNFLRLCLACRVQYFQRYFIFSFKNLNCQKKLTFKSFVIRVTRTLSYNVVWKKRKKFTAIMNKTVKL